MNGESIEADQPVSALAGSRDAVFIDWYPATYGTYEMTITVIPWDATADDPSNNTVVVNVWGQDTDRDGIGNASDDDDDNDGVPDEEDEFPLDRNESVDTDGDGTGDNADDDDDNDGVLDEDDDLPLDPNYSTDSDGDGTADEIDEDVDGDGVTMRTKPLPTQTTLILMVMVQMTGEDAFPSDSDEWERYRR